ncbi:MAG: hypothetical protein IPG56_13610 [Caulobacteraceae bacterium]|nr:hypothetical protein [Caulobacteraceae bacterium]
METLDALGEGPHTLADVEAALPNIPIDDLIKRIILLAAVRVVRPAIAPEQRSVAAPRCAALNAYILSLSGGSGAVLASPVLGAGVEVSPLERALLATFTAGRRSVEECAEEIVRVCPGELRGRSAQDVAALLHADQLPFFRAMGLAGN